MRKVMEGRMTSKKIILTGKFESGEVTPAA
jgi:hypothetical protein